MSFQVKLYRNIDTDEDQFLLFNKYVLCVAAQLFKNDLRKIIPPVFHLSTEARKCSN